MIGIWTDTARIKRMYGEDFYFLTQAQQAARISAMDRQYERTASGFIDDMRLEDWRRGVARVMGASPTKRA